MTRFTKREQQLLATLMRNEGRIMSREELYALVWGGKLRPGDRTVDVHVRKLRVRLEEASQMAFIQYPLRVRLPILARGLSKSQQSGHKWLTTRQLGAGSVAALNQPKELRS